MSAGFARGQRDYKAGAERKAPPIQDVRQRAEWLRGYDDAAHTAQINQNRARMGMPPLREPEVKTT